MAQLIKNISWLIMTLFALFLFAITAEYLSFKSDVNFLLVKQDIVFDSIWRPTFYLHVISGMIVILVGPIQFIPKLRNRFMSFHKILGKIYAYAVLGVAAPTGLIMAFYAEGGIWSTIAFIVMSGLWIITTLLAIIKVKNKDIVGHKKWMYRSYALSFAAVTLRILVPLMSFTNQFDYDFIVVSTAWLSWIINLIAVEIIIYLTFRKSEKLKSN
jgi:hypothetical protein